MKDAYAGIRDISLWKYAVYGFLAGLLFPVFAWAYYTLSENSEFNIENIKNLHDSVALLYFTDIIPFISAAVVLIISAKFKKERREILEQLLLKENLISKYSGYIKKIGKGEYSETANILFEDDLGLSLNEMRENLLKKSINEERQNWIAGGKNITDEILRKHNEIKPLAYDILVNLTEYTGAVQGAFYIFDDEIQKLTAVSSYAYGREKFLQNEYSLGEGLVGQASYEKNVIFRKNLPDDFVTVSSGLLGEKKPKSILIISLNSSKRFITSSDISFCKNAISTAP